jgi:peptidoglycan hydrolase-like protein with peptidoglycan-binding domain
MALTSPRFKDNARLQSAAQNNPVMKFPESGPAVRLLQQALIDSGYPLPVSTQKYGSPDGVYGNETKAAVAKYQKAKSLNPDGICGKKTLTQLDSELRGPVPALPPLPGASSSSYVNYQVPGLFVPVKQKSGMSCWAAMYTMMLSWKDQMSYPVEDAVTRLGDPYPKILADDTGLPITENRRLAGRAGMTAEPLFNPSAQGWEQLLRRHGLLWTSFAWTVTAATGGLVSGRHIIILYGIQGDGTLEGTVVYYADPSDGQKHVQTFKEYVEGHELGFTLKNLTDNELIDFSQIMHY